MNDKLQKIKMLWEKEKHHKLIFEWVKTGVISLKEFEKIIEYVSLLNENESREMYG